MEKTKDKGLVLRKTGAFLFSYISELSKINTHKITRMCFHQSDDSDLHVMMIRVPPNTKYPIHSHSDHDEWYSIVEGILNVDLYDNNLKITDSYVLDSNNNETIGLLIKKGILHSVNTVAEHAIFLEVKPGPFVKSNTNYIK